MPGRGRRNPEQKRAKTERWVKSGGLAMAKKRLDQITVTKTLPKFPSEFLGLQKDGKAVLAAMDTHFPGMIPRELPSASPDGRLFFPTPLPPNGEPLGPRRLPYLAIRFDCVFSKHVTDKLVQAWNLLLATDVEFPPPDKNRSATPALHLGVWELSQNRPYVTADTCQKSPKANAAIDFLLTCIRSDVAPKIARLFQEFCPAQYARLMRAHQRVQGILGPTLKYRSRPCLNFGGIFSTVAVKEGASERLHLDWNDDNDNMAFVVPVGDWEGGEFCSPQLGQKIPIRPGQVFAVTARILVHCSAPVTNGRRVVFTLFTDNVLLKHGDKYKPKIITL